ncbi:DUF1684 domain-containing protein [Pseudoxanthomonas sp. LH2527]|uniref:DUF1684 domain-containing protein n=1 Tax=Pseudoxanthomonas sp. LH2527 TaxID=2923249 RepID=UPI001F13B413|nr:DUF1684 domain-containing protein [Pseudoxanthomonas sp. LH2527]MCH6483755.1 DUF1684 domain-containing protein [Pseudoxanthomonas sp. LH2527]
MGKNTGWLGVAMLLGVLAGCGGDDKAAATGKVADVNFLADNAAWREQRRTELTAPDGWTSLVGLHWIELKSHFIGSGPGSGIKLAVGPAKLGMVTQQDKRVFLTPEGGAALTFNGEPLKGRVELESDRDAQPSVVGFDDGKGVLTVIERGGRHALRVKHADAESRTQFIGLDYWPAEEDWRIEGRFIPHPPGKTLTIVDVIGVASESPNPGVVEFERDGKPYRLEALGQAGGPLFFVLADRTSGHGSYPAGRFLDADAPQAGKLVLDFNRAYNPPCAFTPYATCPLPPAENRLDLAIEAGEKAYAKPIKVL